MRRCVAISAWDVGWSCVWINNVNQHPTKSQQSNLTAMEPGLLLAPGAKRVKEDIQGVIISYSGCVPSSNGGVAYSDPLFSVTWREIKKKLAGSSGVSEAVNLALADTGARHT